MFNALIKNKNKTLILGFPKSIYDLQENLQSIGIVDPQKVSLTDNGDEGICVKLYADNDIGNHLIRVLNEQNSLADANSLALVLQHANDEIKEALEHDILYDQYDSIQEIIDDVKLLAADDFTEEGVEKCHSQALV